MSQGITILACAAVFGLGPLAHLSTLLGSLAQVSVAASSAVNSGIRAFSGASADTATFLVGAISASQSIGREMWAGVDILNTTVVVHTRRVLGDDPSDILEWLK